MAKTIIYMTINYVLDPEKRRMAISIRRTAAIRDLRRRNSFILKQEYRRITSRRRRKAGMIAYHLRQSFKAGKITPEKANRLG